MAKAREEENGEGGMKGGLERREFWSILRRNLRGVLKIRSEVI